MRHHAVVDNRPSSTRPNYKDLEELQLRQRVLSLHIQIGLSVQDLVCKLQYNLAEHRSPGTVRPHALRPNALRGFHVMPNEPKTDLALLERLRIAASREMTPEEVRRQRVSFVYGNLPDSSSMTRHEVEAALARLEGDAA